MSALQEILDKMYIDPEILEQLTDEQKQILFIKMRHEQLRKWRHFEEELERFDDAQLSPDNRETKVRWLLGEDGEVWTWVMGEHPDDMSIDEILEQETKETARQLAEHQLAKAVSSLSDENGANDDDSFQFDEKGDLDKTMDDDDEEESFESACNAMPAVAEQFERRLKMDENGDDDDLELMGPTNLHQRKNSLGFVCRSPRRTFVSSANVVESNTGDEQSSLNESNNSSTFMGDEILSNNCAENGSGDEPKLKQQNVVNIFALTSAPELTADSATVVNKDDVEMEQDSRRSANRGIKSSPAFAFFNKSNNVSNGYGVNKMPFERPPPIPQQLKKQRGNNSGIRKFSVVDETSENKADEELAVLAAKKIEKVGQRGAFGRDEIYDNLSSGWQGRSSNISSNKHIVLNPAHKVSLSDALKQQQPESTLIVIKSDDGLKEMLAQNAISAEKEDDDLPESVREHDFEKRQKSGDSVEDGVVFVKLRPSRNLYSENQIIYYTDIKFIKLAAATPCARPMHANDGEVEV